MKDLEEMSRENQFRRVSCTPPVAPDLVDMSNDFTFPLHVSKDDSTLHLRILPSEGTEAVLLRQCPVIPRRFVAEALRASGASRDMERRRGLGEKSGAGNTSRTGTLYESRRRSKVSVGIRGVKMSIGISWASYFVLSLMLVPVVKKLQELLWSAINLHRKADLRASTCTYFELQTAMKSHDVPEAHQNGWVNPWVSHLLFVLITNFDG